MSTPTTPTTVEVGQIWRDNDQRTKGSGEFVVLAVVGPFYAQFGDVPDHVRPRLERAAKTAEKYARWHDADMVVGRREGRLSVIRAERLLRHSNRRTGYTYLGKSR